MLSGEIRSRHVGRLHGEGVAHVPVQGVSHGRVQAVGVPGEVSDGVVVAMVPVAVDPREILGVDPVGCRRFNE